MGVGPSGATTRVKRKTLAMLNGCLSQWSNMKRARQFDFGKNWTSFSQSALTPERVNRARLDFGKLMEGVLLRDRTFLDIGFGQGLAVCLAQEAGARVFANDINPKCGEALKSTSRFFPSLDLNSIPVVIGSILDDAIVERLHQLSADASGFDVVHSWGVLHHTGAMKEAIGRAGSLVRPNGHLIISIYNAHWTSPVWRMIKRTFVVAPSLIQRILIAFFYPIVLIAKAMVRRGRPGDKERGMDFYHDVIDWIGGYPYEYATPDEIRSTIETLGFRLERLIPAAVPTGCNEFVFRRQ
jgi:2-polyprenyl-3-methyl-5-hydroxy-6-metoxy-1,4-benzoquinol methylase